MFGHRKEAVPLDPVLLAQVNGGTDVDLGTYPEAALAVVGAAPVPGSLAPYVAGEQEELRLDRLGIDPGTTVSAFRQFSDHDRNTAMQMALGQLIAAGALDLPASAKLEKVVAEGHHGKLPLRGPTATLSVICRWLDRHGYPATVDVLMAAREGRTDLRTPDGLPVPVKEACFGLPLSGHEGLPVFLVERQDHPASSRSYTLRTVRREFARMEEFLFAGFAGQPSVNARMRIGQGLDYISTLHMFRRADGKDTASGVITEFRVPVTASPPPAHVSVSRGGLVSHLIQYFDSGLAQTR